MAITQILSLTSSVQWGVRQAAEAENQLTSVERVFEYILLSLETNRRDKGIEKTKKHKIVENCLIEIPAGWPNKGVVEFINVFMRYLSDDPPVLKGLNLIIKANEKVNYCFIIIICNHKNYVL